MSLREWLIAIGTLVILGIVIDGIRRMRRARKESMAISSGMGADDLDESPLDDEYNPELPNGGARTVSRDVLEERGYVRSERPSRFSKTEPKPTRPVYQEPAPEAESGQEHEAQPDPELASDPALSVADDPVEPESGWTAHRNDPDVDDGIVGEPRIARREPEPEKKPAPLEEETSPPLVTSEVEEDTARRETPARASGQPLAGANRPEAREVIVINVLARQSDEFRGEALKKLFEACGLEHGDMDIYHRHEEADTTSPVQFSVANAVEPGTFKPVDMPGLSTPGISFFMSLPGPTKPLQAFEFMLETAQAVVRNLGGELKDERRSVMTPQTIEHCRQRIREFERKQRSQRA
ncbi:cell division protein ZipA-like protein [Marinobacter santoriniensis NKSG1]|uniref:Cell division protein ZipA n=1 Tax=Marinobacter santoriniensis NKSG1 TaxID=1288826 RepID=M7DGA5_9GAMM|nr:cell division protein ZipA [Marinobacter santoriniensis]EMP56707.1 cell division protein ZipA-like protein [Marinobacter santoriniensis NKSG1]